MRTAVTALTDILSGDNFAKHILSAKGILLLIRGRRVQS